MAVQLADTTKALKEKGGIRSILSAVVMICITALIYHFSKAGAGLEAMLYIWANNGKMSGRADGNVYMRNGRIRGFKVPSLVRNAYTSAARGIFSAFSAAWNTLTELQRLTWVNASGQTVSNRFGQPVEIKGKDLYVACNTNLTNAGQAAANSFIADATPVGFLALSAVADDSANTLTMSAEPTTVPTDNTTLVYATAPQKAGVYRPSQSKYKLIGSIAAGTSLSAYDLTPAYTARFGSFVEGQKLFIRFLDVNNLSGLASAPVDCVTTVVA